MEHSDLGSGFQIAMNDLQIRGGGTVLGPSQSGHIASVGHEMYLQLMERAMSELKGEPMELEVVPEIIVNQSAYIPEAYMPDIDQRLVTYRRLARMNAPSDVEDFREELQDRFGPLPEEASALLEKIILYVLCKQIGIQRLELGDKRLVLIFSQKTPVTPEKIMTLIQQDPQRFRLVSDYVLQGRVLSDGRRNGMEAVKKVLKRLI